MLLCAYHKHHYCALLLLTTTTYYTTVITFPSQPLFVLTAFVYVVNTLHRHNSQSVLCESTHSNSNSTSALPRRPLVLPLQREYYLKGTRVHSVHCLSYQGREVFSCVVRVDLVFRSVGTIKCFALSLCRIPVSAHILSAPTSPGKG